jgi:hypothetical protein
VLGRFHVTITPSKLQIVNIILPIDNYPTGRDGNATLRCAFKLNATHNMKNAMHRIGFMKKKGIIENDG